MLRYVKFYCDCVRMGSLDGKFLLDQEKWDKLQGLIGKDIYFGEVLGKHSDVRIFLEKDMLNIVTDDQDFLNKAIDLGVDLNSGFNPLNYYGDGLEDTDYNY